VSEQDAIRAARRSLGRQIAGWRLKAGLTQGQLARRTGFDRSTIAHAEAGDRASRDLAEAADKVLCAGGRLTAARDAITAAVAARAGPVHLHGREHLSRVRPARGRPRGRVAAACRTASPAAIGLTRGRRVPLRVPGTAHRAAPSIVRVWGSPPPLGPSPLRGVTALHLEYTPIS
jgi:transcriptional regulator with XRE-family HTH domain